LSPLFGQQRTSLFDLAPCGRTADTRLTENAIRTTFRLDGAIAVDTHNSKFVSAAWHMSAIWRSAD
jgi:hypothetical protein